MIFIKRNASGEVIAASREPVGCDNFEPGGWDVANGDEPEVVAFFALLTESANPLSPSDLGLVRVLEDLIDLLIDRGVIRFTDLPPAAQGKLMERRGTRDAMHRLASLDGSDDVL
ncbi:hypothetical protein PA01_05750 [Azoarcus sp. PA01]|nr:hypothetical protein PA01_05750 [Azoarcus sp. PA01]